ncbi:MAG: penicillin-binding protein 2 [Candidatus Pacebacteria bacterium]|nr:penicillin-binding protein 2 [Candidatus Paceibacterota bacterium]
MSSNKSFTRITGISLILCIVTGVLIARLFYLQVLRGDEFSQQVSSKLTSSEFQKFERGTIFSQKKDGTLVSAGTSVSGYMLTINKDKAGDTAELLQKLKEIIPDMDVDFYNNRVQKGGTHVDAVMHVTQSEYEAINALKNSGLAFKKDHWRFYPGGQMSARTIGFVAFKGNEIVGRYGLERFYNDTLTLNKNPLYSNFFTEVFSTLHDSVFNENSTNGDVITSLEPSVTQYVEKLLSKTLDKYSAEGAGAIIMNPRNGEIYAMTYLPTFDLNNFSDVDSVSTYNNPLVESVYEFGSIVKPLVMAAGLDTNAVRPDTTYIDKGELTINTEKIHNFDKKARGKATMQDVLTQSLNTGMVFVMQQMGKENFKNYMLAYGIGEKTGIDLPGEVSGITSNLKSNREIEYANAAFGQGIAMTPVEVIRAFSALANGGMTVTPHVAKAVKTKDGEITPLEFGGGTQVISAKASEDITKMLVTVVDKGLGAGQYKNEHYSVAAKTGTAQIALENGRGYHADQYLHSLFGYYPAYNPQFLVLMYVKNPRGVQYATATLAEPFFDLSKYLLSYYDVAPDR